MKHIVHVGAGGERGGSNPELTYHYFEPREDQVLSKLVRDNINVYPFAILDYDGEGTLHVTKKVSCSSFLEPNLELLQKIQPTNWKRFEIQKSIQVPVRRLDSLLDPSAVIQHLIIDTQGSELSVLQGCGDLLNNTVKITCEVEYVELYKDQPLYSDISEYLSTFGFKLEGFVRKVRWNEATPVFADAIFKKA